VSYLGLLLTVTKPTKDLFYPLIERVERRLEAWKGKLISKGGRAQLVDSVLSALPVYAMACFKLPKWVIKRLEKIMRDFLWEGRTSTQKGAHLINGQTLCIPKKWGGLGFKDLAM
jgi:hypothetical protein